MMLISNAKTMIKLYVTVAVIAVLSVVGIYYYFNTMTTVNGGLNINKIKNVDKVYSRSIYSDFYFRAVGFPYENKKDFIGDMQDTVTKKLSFFNENKVENVKSNASYFKLLPQKVSLGYDFTDTADPKFILQNKNVSEGAIIDDESGEVAKYKTYIDLIEKFSTTFGRIVATQDQDYFDDVFEDTKEIFKELYGVDINLSKIDKSSFYNKIPVAINNMKIEYYKLDKFKLDDYLKNKEWQPQIAYWSWGESEIYLQLLGRAKKVDLDALDELSDRAIGNVVVKTIKINNNHVNKLILTFIGNDVRTVLQSKDGYLYLLKMHNTSISSLKTGMDDFLKIAYGIYFTNDATDVWLEKKQSEIEDLFKNIDSLEKEIAILKKDLGDKIETPKYPGRWDQKFFTFKKFYGSFPNKSIVKKLESEKQSLEKRKEDGSVVNTLKNTYDNMVK